MSNTLNNDLREALVGGQAKIKDPGANGTITFPGDKALAHVTLASAGTNAFSSAADVPLGALLIVFAQASVTVNSVALADGEFAEFFVTLDSSGAHQWSLRSIANTAIADTFADGAELSFGDSDDAQIGWETGDASNHALVIAAGDSNGAIHFTDKGAIGTDWNLSADTDVTGYFHSNTTPATDYVSIGAHDGTTAHINVAGGTTLSVDIDGTASFTATATTLKVADSISVTFGTGDDIVMAWDGTDFDVTQATANSSIKWGVDDAGMDQVWYGDTASSNMTWDQSADTLILNAANLRLATSGTIDANGIADALVLDADADTTISAPTDDQIDIEVGGGDVIVVTATACTFADTCFPVLPTTDTDGTVTGSIWYDASENKLKFKTAGGVETITSA